jgi:hypothetical protein
VTAFAAAGTPLKERLQVIIDHALWGAYSETPRSEAEQEQLAADHAVLDREFRAVDAAPTDDMARMAYLRCFLDLGGITPQQAIADLAAIRLERRLEVLEAAGGTR